MQKNILSLLFLLIFTLAARDIYAQAAYFGSARVLTPKAETVVTLPAPDSAIAPQVMALRETLGFATDSILPQYSLEGADKPFPAYFFLPAVYDHFTFEDLSDPLAEPLRSDNPSMARFED